MSVNDKMVADHASYLRWCSGEALPVDGLETDEEHDGQEGVVESGLGPLHAALAQLLNVLYRLLHQVDTNIITRGPFNYGP